jgi:hypothetical protein
VTGRSGSASRRAGRPAAQAPAGLGDTATIPNAALFIPISPELGAAEAGELLLSYINDEERWGYSTYEFLRGNFRLIDDLPPLDVRTLCCGCWANTPGQGDQVSWWRSDELGLDVFLHWDGDGTIVFQTAAWTLENGDCKNDGDWEWVTPDHWSIDYKHYEDGAQAIEARRAVNREAGAVGDESAVAASDAPNTPSQPSNGDEE